MRAAAHWPSSAAVSDPEKARRDAPRPAGLSRLRASLRDPRYRSRMADESHKERVDRELIELLNELRVALPGVQVLFAFLLGIPFTNRFKEVSGAEDVVYLVALLSTATATALLKAPSAIHRLRFRQGRKEEILLESNRLAIVGIGMLAVSVAASVYLVVSFLHGPRIASALTLAVGALLVWLWFALPLAGRR